jgi:hypothetical protein
LLALLPVETIIEQEAGTHRKPGTVDAGGRLLTVDGDAGRVAAGMVTGGGRFTFFSLACPSRRSLATLSKRSCYKLFHFLFILRTVYNEILFISRGEKIYIVSG